VNEQASTADVLPAGEREKRRVAGASLAAALLLTGTKLGVGLWTNSLGILSEAAHSAFDLLAAGMTLWAVRVAGQPADQQHLYGHGKFENFSALLQTVLLLATCGWIGYEAVMRLFIREEAHVEANIWAFAVVVLSIVVDISRSTALSRAARKYRSQALEADALHFSSDIWSSVVVLLGLCGVYFAEQWRLPWLVGADAVAALFVALIVIGVGLRLGHRSLEALLDGVPQGLPAEVAAAVRDIPGVENLLQLRLRRSGPTIFADLTLAVARGTAFEQAHEIAHRVEDAVKALLPDVDLVVHVEPVAAEGDEEITATVRRLAARHGLAAHGVRIYKERQQWWLEMHLEVGAELSLEEAHRQATAFENELRIKLPALTRIVTHIEPVSDAVATRRGTSLSHAQVRAAIDDFLSRYPLSVKPHDIRVQEVDNELAISFHCTLDAATAITAAHDLTVRLEEHLRAHIPGVGRVVIHVEPDPT